MNKTALFATIVAPIAALAWDATHCTIAERAYRLLPASDHVLIGDEAEMKEFVRHHTLIPDIVDRPDGTEHYVWDYCCTDKVDYSASFGHFHLWKTAPEVADFIGWYLPETVRALKERRIRDFACLAGCLGHALGDWTCPPHANDGDVHFLRYRKAHPPPANFDEVLKGRSMHQLLENVRVDLSDVDYVPRVLGETMPEAERVLAAEAAAYHAEVRELIGPMAKCAYAGDTNGLYRIQKACAVFGTRLVADMLHTVCRLSSVPATYDSFRPGKEWRDTEGHPIQAHGGSIIKVGDTYWWYGENKERTDGKGEIWHWGMRAYSSTDLYNWKNEGIIIPPDLDDPKSPLHPHAYADRPHILYNERTRKFVCWIKVMQDPEQTMTLLTSDSIKGPWTRVRAGLRPCGLYAGDFDLVKSPDGRAFAYFERPHVELVAAELTDDYLDAKTHKSYFPLARPPFTREAPAYFHYAGRHYLLTSGTTGYWPNPSEFAVADDYLGPWKRLCNACPTDKSETSFHAQFSSVFKVPGKKDLYIALGDRWIPSQMDLPYSVVSNAFDKATSNRGDDADCRHFWETYASAKTPPTSEATYVWLPIVFKDGKPEIVWRDEWKLEDFPDEAEGAADPTSIWNRSELYRVPKTWDNQGPFKGEVTPMWIEGEPFKGRQTRVFAFVGLPECASVSNKVPGIVLVHGGNGTAYPEWVRLWVRRGYAAIAVDNCGQLPVLGTDRTWMANPDGGPRGWGGTAVKHIDEPVKDQWMYHAVAASVRAHSYLRSLDCVDTAHIGVTGISWGGVQTCILAAVDDRFAYAAPVYGCGFNGETGGLMSEECVGSRGPDWASVWDPARFLPFAKIPFLWVDGTNDFAFELDRVMRSAALTKGPSYFCTRLRMVHAHGAPGEAPQEILAFADSFARGGRGLVRLSVPTMDDGTMTVRFDGNGRKLVRAELLWTGDGPAVKAADRNWHAMAVERFDPESGCVCIPLPREAVQACLNLIDEDGLIHSSRTVYGIRAVFAIMSAR